MDYLIMLVLVVWPNLLIFALVACAKTKYPEPAIGITRQPRPTGVKKCQPPVQIKDGLCRDKVVPESNTSPDKKNEIKKREIEKVQSDTEPESDPVPVTLNGLMRPGEQGKFEHQKEIKNNSDAETDFRSLEERFQKDLNSKNVSINGKTTSVKRQPNTVDGTQNTQYGGSNRRKVCVKSIDTCKESVRFDNKPSYAAEPQGQQTQMTNYQAQVTQKYIAPSQSSNPSPFSGSSET